MRSKSGSLNTWHGPNAELLAFHGLVATVVHETVRQRCCALRTARLETHVQLVAADAQQIKLTEHVVSAKLRACVKPRGEQCHAPLCKVVCDNQQSRNVLSVAHLEAGITDGR